MCYCIDLGYKKKKEEEKEKILFIYFIGNVPTKEITTWFGKLIQIHSNISFRLNYFFIIFFISDQNYVNVFKKNRISITTL